MYNPNIPQPGDLLSVSQNDILVNFQTANTIFDAEHFTFNNATPTQRGKHRYIHLENRTGTEPTTGANEGAWYMKTVSGNLQPVFRRESNGAELWGTPIRAFVAFDGTAASPIAPLNAYNVGNITVGGGAYTIPFSGFTFTNTNYTVLVSCAPQSSSFLYAPVVVSRSVNSCVVRIQLVNLSTFGSATTSPYISVLILGGTLT